MDLWEVQCHILVPFGLIIGIQFFQVFIQQAAEGYHTFRRTIEFDDPLVPALRILAHIDRSGRVIGDLGICCLRGELKRTFGIFHDQFFAEGIDEVLGASRYPDPVGSTGGEYHRITQRIAPQTAICSNH